jgi:hypothetical protein
VLVRNNLITNYNDSQNNHNSNCLTTYRASNITIEHNECHTTNTGFHVKGNNPGPITIRYNLIHDARHAGVMLTGFAGPVGTGGTMHNNVIYNAWVGVSFQHYREESGPHDLTVVNNTFVGMSGVDGGAILFRDGAAFYRNLRLYNNIFARSQAGAAAWAWADTNDTNIDMAYNVFSQNTTPAYVLFRSQSFATWQSTYHQDEIGSLLTTVNFVDEAARNYRLPAGSPVASAGLDILDLNRNGSTTDRIPMGAYITGNEIIGRINVTRPNPPTDTRSQ